MKLQCAMHCARKLWPSPTQSVGLYRWTTWQLPQRTYNNKKINTIIIVINSWNKITFWVVFITMMYGWVFIVLQVDFNYKSNMKCHDWHLSSGSYRLEYACRSLEYAEAVRYFKPLYSVWETISIFEFWMLNWTHVSFPPHLCLLLFLSLPCLSSAFSL